MKILIYTSIFGAYDGLLPQKPIPGVDFICFTDQNLKAKPWKVIRKTALYPDDSTRSARYYKINAHKILPDYDISIYMDGNILITGDIFQLIENHLKEVNMLVFDHNQSSDKRNTVQEELQELIRLGTVKDDPVIMEKQYEHYLREGFPDNGGLIFSAVLIRKHHKDDVEKMQDCWWKQITQYSKRDQLSFNYAAWKTGLNFKYLDGDLRDGNPWFHMIGVHRKDYKWKYFRYRLKNFFGLK